MENEIKTNTVSNIIRLPEDIHQKIKIKAAMDNKSIHDVMVEAVELGLKQILRDVDFKINP